MRPVWPPASVPCATTTSVPPSAMRRAFFTLPTSPITFAPWAWNASAYGAGLPEPGREHRHLELEDRLHLALREVAAEPTRRMPCDISSCCAALGQPELVLGVVDELAVRLPAASSRGRFAGACFGASPSPSARRCSAARRRPTAAARRRRTASTSGRGCGAPGARSPPAASTPRRRCRGRRLRRPRRRVRPSRRRPCRRAPSGIRCRGCRRDACAGPAGP